ncbi:hypothetical protein IJ118_00885 [Candidatus Saccharibacteria bacterium]|nr:hypothetical protein [Candidatus Saccharibacteria bacterium]
MDQNGYYNGGWQNAGVGVDVNGPTGGVAAGGANAGGLVGGAIVSGDGMMPKKNEWRMVKITAALCAVVLVITAVIVAVIKIMNSGTEMSGEVSVSDICEMEIADDLSVYNEYKAKYELYDYFYHCTATGQSLMLAMENSAILWGIDEATDADLGVNEYMTVDVNEMDELERKLWEYLY